MKFAKELEEDLVPEWRVKYLNYKAGKKYVKSVARAVRKANATPSIRRRSGDGNNSQQLPPHPTPSFLTPPRRVNFVGTTPGSSDSETGGGAGAGTGGGGRPKRLSSSQATTTVGLGGSSSSSTATKPIPARKGGDGGRLAGEKQRLTDSPGAEMRYGSLIATPPTMPTTPLAQMPSHQPHFELPAPAINYGAVGNGNGNGSSSGNGGAEMSKKPSSSLRGPLGAIQRSFSLSGPFPTASFFKDRASTQTHLQPPPAEHFTPRPPLHAQTFSFGGAELSLRDSGGNGGTPNTPQQRFRRLFSTPSPGLARRQSRAAAQASLASQYQDEVRQREAEFFAFLDGELSKVDNFYRLKEEQAGQRLSVLREQLHVMRNRRGREIDALRKKRREEVGEGDEGEETEVGGDEEGEGGGGSSGTKSKRKKAGHSNGNGHGATVKWVEPVKSKLFGPRPGPNSKALQAMARTTPRLQPAPDDPNNNNATAAASRKDYTRRRRPASDQDVPYRTAKRKLKLALQEFYRGLELLKSYALLNRTAFRKLNKKYDKAVNAIPSYAYMNRVVNEAYFVKSTALDSLLASVEDLYARYFERGNHKIAAGKLRALTSRRPGDESASAFRSGLAIGLGLVLAVQGLIWGVDRLSHDEDPELRLRTSYLLQLYAGYFLMLYLFVLFVLDCRLWTRAKVNYHFIFEFDARSQLDWRQLSQFPSFFLLVFGLFIWLNFSGLGSAAMYLYWPVVMVGVSAVVLFFPAPVFFYRSRRWFLYSHWRLLLAGLYPVEFRDFFFGDMYCSLTYAMCNVELFFCLYHRAWDDPPQCNSSNSRLLGFFSTLPAIWRALQCIRRYRDTRNVFPHLVNCGKYTMTILAAVWLSLYRIHNSPANLALFIAFASINAIYCSVWDLFMDWSLLQPAAHNFLLRDIIALKQRWVYYAAMALDPLLRFAWVFYAIFAHDTQHSTIVSFMVAFAEISRRGMWTVFRVENEHCANVAQYKASRDVPLPYQMMDVFAAPHPDAEALLPAGGAAALALPLLGEMQDATTAAPSPADGRPGGADAGVSTGVDLAGKRKYPATPSPVADARAAEEGRAGLATPSPAGAAAGAAAPTTPVPPSQPQQQQPEGGFTLRRRLTRADSIIGGISRVMAEAHKQDFEKKRRPPHASAISTATAASTVVEDEEEEEEEDVCFSNEDDDDDDEEDDEEEDLGGGGFADQPKSPSSPSPPGNGSGGGTGPAVTAAFSGATRIRDFAGGGGLQVAGSSRAAAGASGCEDLGPLDEVRGE